jgi:hypothetical protein
VVLVVCSGCASECGNGVSVSGKEGLVGGSEMALGSGISWAVVEVSTELQALELSKISRMTITHGVVQGFTAFLLWMYSRDWSVGLSSALRTIVVYKSKQG